MDGGGRNLIFFKLFILNIHSYIFLRTLKVLQSILGIAFFHFIRYKYLENMNIECTKKNVPYTI